MSGINYVTGGHTFGLNYQDLRAKHIELCEMSDHQFTINLPQAAHLACIISYIKGKGNEQTIGDKGIVHELIHMMCEGTTTPLHEVRDQFRTMLELAP